MYPSKIQVVSIKAAGTLTDGLLVLESKRLLCKAHPQQVVHHKVGFILPAPSCLEPFWLGLWSQVPQNSCMQNPHSSQPMLCYPFWTKLEDVRQTEPHMCWNLHALIGGNS